MSQSTALKRAVAEQNTVWKRMQEIQAAAEEGEGRDLTAEERTNWDAAEVRLGEVSSDIERFERLAKLEQIDRGQVLPTSGDDGGENRGEAAAEAYRAAFSQYLRRGINGLNAEQRDLMEKAHTEFDKSDTRALTTGSDTAGGFTVPEQFQNKMTETMKAFGGLAGIANVITTATGQDLPWIGNDDTANEGEIIGENTEVGDQDVAWTGRKLKAHIFSSRKLKVPLALLQDSAFSLDVWLPKKLGERIGRRAARAWITGTGIDQPEGITTNVITGKTGANGQTTSVIYDDLIDLEHSIDPAYRRNGNARYLFSDSTLKVLRKLKDNDGRPLWVPIPTVGETASINGYGYTIDNAMPTPAANAKSILFGDFNAGYIIRNVQGVQTMRLTERYAEFLQVAFLAFARMDGMVDDPSAVRAYVHPAA